MKHESPISALWQTKHSEPQWRSGYCKTNLPSLDPLFLGPWWPLSWISHIRPGFSSAQVIRQSENTRAHLDHLCHKFSSEKAQFRCGEGLWDEGSQSLGFALSLPSFCTARGPKRHLASLETVSACTKGDNKSFVSHKIALSTLKCMKNTYSVLDQQYTPNIRVLGYNRCHWWCFLQHFPPPPYQFNKTKVKVTI